MDQNQQDQTSGADQNPSKKEINLGDILLPKQNTPSVDSAQRVDAGTLLQQEQSATLPKPPPITPPVSQPPPPLEDHVAPLQTFQSDIASTMKEKGSSVVSIAAAEAERRSTQPVSQDAQLHAGPSHSIRNIFFSIFGFLFMAGAAGVLIYVLVLRAPFPASQANIAPFIAIDGTSNVSVASTTQGRALIQQLTAAKTAVSLPFGLVSHIYIEKDALTSDTDPQYMDAQSLFSLMTPGIPATLLRNIAPVYLLGIHSFGTNEPFLILKVDSYELAYAGMLAWERTIKQELSPLFSRAPTVATPSPAVEIQTGLASTSATTSTAMVASTTTATSSTQATSTILLPVASSTPETPVLQTGFTDAIIENHDTRVTKDRSGSIDFLWTFLDRRTIVITTNPGTLREIITRLKHAPLISQPSAR